MAEATALETLSPKELGKHLREVRRRKGLSLSEVARGAGLTRRELSAYEKGKSPIPDSDLFVLAGSCGVDVAELRVPTTAAELGAAHQAGNALVPANSSPVPSSIGDAVAQLRRAQPVAPPSVPQSSRFRRPRALGSTDVAPVEPSPSEWPEPADSSPVAAPWPDGASIPSVPSPSAADARAPAEPIDIFEELARLPEPEPLSTDDLGDHDIFSPPPGGAHAFHEWPAFESDRDHEDPHDEDAVDESGGEPFLVEMPSDVLPDPGGAADAPPINVEMRGESFNSPWDSLRHDDALSTPDEAEAVFGGADDWRYATPDDVVETVADADVWEPVAVVANANSQWFDAVSSVPTPDTDPSAFDEHVDDGWADLPDVFEPVDTFGTSDANDLTDVGTEASVAPIFDPRFAVTPVDSAPGSWAHEPDPDATSTGFYIDWGEADDDASTGAGTSASAWDLPTDSDTEAEAEEDLADEPESPAAAHAAPWDFTAAAQDFETDLVDLDPEPEFEAVAVAEPPGFGIFAPVVDEPIEASEPDPLPAPPEPLDPGLGDGEDELPVISWRPQLDGSLAPAVEALILSLAEPPVLWVVDPVNPVEPVEAVDEAEPEPEPEPEPVPETFVAAGSEWVLGNAVPLVEVRSTGGLVMRRADERWALADVVAPSNFALEVDVDLRSGPGFGVLFCADVDDQGRMSGYSFDVDPVYEGGGYLVREWCADREQWNPIAHVSAAGAAGMNGLLEVRVTLDDGRLVASVNGETVLTVENLLQASIDRGRAGASGHRVGVQAWSSTDLVIDELRLANH